MQGRPTLQIGLQKRLPEPLCQPLQHMPVAGGRQDMPQREQQRFFVPVVIEPKPQGVALAYAAADVVQPSLYQDFMFANPARFQR